MKILVCGKGGCGKSTISTLLSKEIAARDNKVLVIDSDESNIGLHSRLGMPKPEDLMNYFGGRKLLFERTKEMQNKWGLDDLPRGYVAERGNILLISMGKIYNFGEGCACPINVMSSRFLENLELKDGEYLIADTDAGIEHFGRGVERGIDVLLTVVDPSRESILLANKIAELGFQAGKPVYYVLNRVADAETEKLLLNAVDSHDVIAVIPEIKEIFISGLKGEEFNMDVGGIRSIADKLESLKTTGI